MIATGDLVRPCYLLEDSIIILLFTDGTETVLGCLNQPEEIKYCLLVITFTLKSSGYSVCSQVH